MPRQPYFPRYPKTPPVYGIAHPERMTTMAEAVGRCIMIFSYVDWQMALVLAAIMKAQSEASIAIFLALRNARAQRDVLIAASEMTLQEREREREAFDAILTVYGSLQAQRADIAHGIFGLIPDVEDEAAWVQTKDLSKYWVERFHSRAAAKLDAKADVVAAVKEERRREQERLMHLSSVYKPTDLAQLMHDIKELWKASFHFYQHLRYGETPLSNGEFQKVCDVPQIARELARMRDQKNNPTPAE